MDPTPAQDTLLLVCTYTNNDILAHLPKGELGRGVYSLRLDALSYSGGRLRLPLDSLLLFARRQSGPSLRLPKLGAPHLRMQTLS